jgi:hypothetical protein
MIRPPSLGIGLPMTLPLALLLAFPFAGCREPPRSERQGSELQCSEPERAGDGNVRAGLVQPPPAAAAPTPEAIALCDALQRRPLQRKAECCGSAPLSATFDACVRALDRALVSGSVQLDTAALERCASAVELERSGCDWVTPGVPLPPDACRALIVGRVRAGGACHSSLECAAPLHCAGATPAEAGTCAEPLGVGAACARTSDALASLLMADVEPEHPLCAGICSFGAGQCQATAPRAASAPAHRGAPGEACSTDFDCARGGCADDGECGMKCTVSLEGLSRLATARALVMTRAPRTAD